MADAVPSVLPTGTVTLLLTDVEGSTQLWESGPDAAADAIARHYELLDAAIVLHGGARPVEQGEGDSVVAAFKSATDAVAAALDIQRAFAEETWHAERAVRVRMALHTGEIRLRDAGNYFGPTIIRCARMRSVGHGGQILISDATRELVIGGLPDDAELRDLGPHRLKDLGRPERIWQLVHPDVAAEFPPLRSLGVMATNLPSQVSSFVGRDDEIAAVHSALREHRLVTLTGTGGCGKTRLALQAAAEELDARADGVWFVELAAVAHGGDVAQSVASVLALREEFGRSLVDTLIEQLRERDTLLVIDNCEQVLDSAARLVEALLQGCPRLRVLATSREPLGLAGEVAWRVPSLDESTAVALFIERAQQARPGFVPDADGYEAIRQIAERLDGLPLALELAAARTRMMHPARIASALDDRFRLLTGGTRTATPRQQTLEASIAWGYELLDADERALARALSVLHGFALDAAEVVATDDDADRYGVLDTLARLVDKSIVQVSCERGEDRYRMLESVRQFLQARLVESGEADSVRARHFAFFLDRVEQLAPRLAMDSLALGKLEADHDNLDLAMEWGATAASPDEMLRFATALTLFWELRGHLGKGGRWFARVLGVDGQPSALRARALWGAAHVALYGDDFDTMMVRAPQALEMAEAVGDDWAAARALNTLGFAETLVDPPAGRAALLRSIELGEAIGDDWAVADGKKMVTVSHMAEHDARGAETSLAELRRVAEALGSKFFLAWYYGLVGYFAAHRGDFAAAHAAFDASASCCREVGDPSTGGFTEAWWLGVRGAEGDPAAATELEAFIARASALGSGLAIADACVALADILVAEDEAERAAALLETVLDALGEAAPPIFTMFCLRALGAARRTAGELDAADVALDNAAALGMPLRNEWLLGQIDYERALVASARGEAPRAEDLLHTALTRQAHHDFRPDIAATLDALGALALDAESPSEAVRCFAAADALRSAIGIVLRSPAESARAERLAVARDLLGPDAFEVEWSEAATRPYEDMIEYVSRARGERKRPSVGWASLTPTEERVVALVTDGLTNPQIAERMFIARGTVKVHLAHVFAKLGVATRAELAAQATKRASAQTSA
jgi:predicted ATPase/class 3 adenylate cyclase/DNA-binding CsgD family transcriptional regulator